MQIPVLRAAQCRLLCGQIHPARSVLAFAPLLLRRKAAHRSTCMASAGVTDPVSMSHAESTESLPPMSWEGRDRNCGTLSEQDIGKSFALCGWVHRQRNLGGGFQLQPCPPHHYLARCPNGQRGYIRICSNSCMSFEHHTVSAEVMTVEQCSGLCFVDLRDASGIVQVCHPYIKPTPLIIIIDTACFHSEACICQFGQ